MVEKLAQFPETKELAKTKGPTLTRMPEIPDDNLSFDHIDELDFVEFQSKTLSEFFHRPSRTDN